MAICKCGDKLRPYYYQDGGGALECRGCGRFEERRVASIQPIYKLLKELTKLSNKGY